MQCVVLENLCFDFDTAAYEKATRVCKVATCVCKGETHQQAMALLLALHSLPVQVHSVFYDVLRDVHFKLALPFVKARLQQVLALESSG